MAFAGRDSPFPSGPSMSCAVSSGAQQPRADIFSALLKQPCLLADALITSSGEMLSRSSSTGMLPRPHPVSRAPPRSPQRVGRPGTRGEGQRPVKPLRARWGGRPRAAPAPRAGRDFSATDSVGRGFSTTDSARPGGSAPQTAPVGVSTPRTAPVVFQHLG